jgi:hypothetical protein
MAAAGKKRDKEAAETTAATGDQDVHSMIESFVRLEAGSEEQDPAWLSQQEPTYDCGSLNAINSPL